MKSVLFSLPPERLDEALTAFWECNTKGIQETAEGLRVFFDDDVDLSDLLQRFSGREIRAEEPFEYQSCSDAECDPILAGNRFYIASPGHTDAPPDGRLRLTAAAGTAFGTGRHETTQLMLEALERELQPGCTVLDIGCGTTILAQAALLLGAGKVAACDIDPQILCGLQDEMRSRVFLGSADAVRTAAADLVLANISAKVIDGIAHDLNRIAKPGGLLILSGFIRDLVPQRFQPETELVMGDWLCWICRPTLSNSIAPQSPQAHSLQWF